MIPVAKTNTSLMERLEIRRCGTGKKRGASQRRGRTASRDHLTGTSGIWQCWREGEIFFLNKMCTFYFSVNKGAYQRRGCRKL